MSSTDLKGDAIGFFADNQRSILAVVGAAFVLLLLMTLLGGPGVLGSILFVGYGIVWLVVVGFVIWLFYRLVVAAERIATAQERIANAQATTGTEPVIAESDSETATGATTDDRTTADDEAAADDETTMDGETTTDDGTTADDGTTTNEEETTDDETANDETTDG